MRHPLFKDNTKWHHLARKQKNFHRIASWPDASEEPVLVQDT